MKNNTWTSWLIFLILCLIWGSSFILMKWGMYDANRQPVLSSYQVAALRIFSSGIVMTPFAVRAFRQMDRVVFWYVLLSGFLGSFFPAFLFCIAETKIDGAVVGSLNATTPLFVVITGILFFNISTSSRKIIGVLVGLAGSGLLLLTSISQSPGNLAFTGLVLLATLLYGLNVNMVHTKLKGVRSIHIAAVAFTSLIPPSFLILLLTGFFNLPLHEYAYTVSTIASVILGVVGTAVASILFYVLVKKSGGLFASLVTYGIPFVAVAWGLYYGEVFKGLQIVALLIILLGVYLANKPMPLSTQNKLDKGNL